MKRSLTGFILRKKAASLMEWPQIGKFLLYSFLTVFIAGMYGIGGAFLLDELVLEKGYSPGPFIVGYTLLMGLVFLLMDIFPFLKRSGLIFPPYLPVSNRQQLRINLTLGLLRYMVIYSVLMQVLLVSISEVMTLEMISYSSVVMLTVFLFNRLLKNLMEYQVMQSKMLLTAGISVLILVAMMYIFFWNEAWAGLLSLLVLPAMVYIYIRSDIQKKWKPEVQTESYRSGLFSRIFTNREVKMLLLVGAGFKIVMLGMATAVLAGTGKNIFGMDFFIWLMASPMILFTYIGYNFFGINRRFLFTHLLRHHSKPKLFRVYSSFMVPLLIADTILYMIFLTVLGWMSLSNLMFYITSMLFFYFTAFPVCLRTPVIKAKYLSMDFMQHGGKNISWTAMIFALGGFALCYLVKDYWFFWMADLAFIGAAYAVFRLVPLPLSDVSKDFYLKTRAVE